jgi:hypothetical protein
MMSVRSNCLERHVYLDARWDVDEAAARPHCRVDRREVVVLGRDHGGEVLLEDVGVLFEAGVGIQEDDALALPLLLEGVVDHLGLVLRADAREDALFGVGDAQAFVGLADFLGDLVPGLGGALAVLRANVEVDVVEVEPRELRPPFGATLLLGDGKRLEAKVEHPLGFLLVIADLLDDAPAQALLAPEEVVLLEAEVVLLLVMHSLELVRVGVRFKWRIGHDLSLALTRCAPLGRQVEVPKPHQATD